MRRHCGYIVHRQHIELVLVKFNAERLLTPICPSLRR